MSALSEADRMEMRHATYEAGLALVDDLEHLRNTIITPAPTAGDIRRLSNQLRRILVDGDLRKIAAPRIGRIALSAPDILPLHRSGVKKAFTFLSAGVADIFGLSIDAWMVDAGPKARNILDFEPGKVIRLKLDGFLKQDVICFAGTWISRSDTIKFIAHVAHGVHSDISRLPSHELLQQIRHIATISLDDEMPTLSFNPGNIRPGDKPLSVDRKAIDFVLLQLLSCARYLTTSEDVIILEDAIKNEAPL